MSAPSKLIKLSHARDHLRQHFAIDAGLDTMNAIPLGSDPKDVDPETRNALREQMQRCRDNAHWEISGMIGGAKITVWKERSDGGLEPAGARWAQQAFDAKGTGSDILYFDRNEWEVLLSGIASDHSQRYLARLSPLPASLPGIGQVMGLVEAISWTAHGKPSNDLPIWETAAGECLFRDSSGAVHHLGGDNETPEVVALSYAGEKASALAIWNMLCDGVLASFVLPPDGQPLAIPRGYWKGVLPDVHDGRIDHIYQGISDEDKGTGCPVLLSRRAFEDWRNATNEACDTPIAVEPQSRAPSVKASRPPSDNEILAKADEMKQRGLDGRTIAARMRSEAGFEQVATTAVRELILGRWKPGGRPKKPA